MSHYNCITAGSDRQRGKHLNFEDRCAIKIYRKMKLSLRKTAEIVNCSASTVINELKRGTGERKGDRGRHPENSARRGQKAYESNRLMCGRTNTVTADNPFISWVIDCVRNKKWSLDARVGHARKNKLFPEKLIVCTKTLYNAVWEGVLLSPFSLPEALSRSTKRRNHSKNTRVLGASIEERPEIVSLRTECGHWEIDTVVGHRNGKESVVLTLVEKVTDYYIAIKIPDKTSKSVNAALEVLREEYGKEYFSTVFKTITADNGSEFDNLSNLEEYGIKVYFAHPYSSLERLQNERRNRIFRRYAPKGVSIEKYSAGQILRFADDMNALPRKALGYSTPEELFDSFLDRVYYLRKEHSDLIDATSVQLKITI